MQQLIKMNKASVASSIAIQRRLKNYSTHYISCIQRPSRAALALYASPPSSSVRFSTSVAYDIFTPTDQFMARHMGSQGDYQLLSLLS